MTAVDSVAHLTASSVVSGPVHRCGTVNIYEHASLTWERHTHLHSTVDSARLTLDDLPFAALLRGVTEPGRTAAGTPIRVAIDAFWA
ncbi:hypothetical protein Trydic_g17677 [Trypoxylus dichotomus]